MEQTHDMDNFTKLTKEKYDISVKEDSIFNIVPELDDPYFYILREGTPVDETGKTITNKSGNLGYYSTDKGIVLLAKGRTMIAPIKLMFQENGDIDPNKKFFVFVPYGTLPYNPITGENIPHVILSKNEINEQLQLTTPRINVGGSRRGHKYNKYKKYNNRGKSENPKRGSTTRRALKHK
jgi:hypothetical protein